MSPKAEMNSNDFIDIQRVGQEQSDNDQEVVGAVARSRYPSAD